MGIKFYFYYSYETKTIYKLYKTRYNCMKFHDRLKKFGIFFTTDWRFSLFYDEKISRF